MTIQNVHPTISTPNYQHQYNLTTEYGYDLFGRQVIVTDTLGHATWTFYNIIGQVISTVINYQDGRHTSDDAPDEDIITLYGYDAAGNLTLF